MQVGQQFGPFTIDKELGSGAMGSVYRGRFSKTGQVMAIKVMVPGLGSTNAAANDRFEREISILKQLNHPNIVRFHGAGKEQKSRYFAMEYIEGESLDHVMARRGRMTWEEVVALGRQLCAALQHAHEKGIIHRDLKPSNIMVLPDGTLKLTDFGIAKACDLEALTQTNCTVGTASYMSPEQCKGQSDLTHKSDLYSLGVLFYELLTGRKPFKADNAMDMFMQHVKGTFERPSRLVLDIPVWLDTLVCQLLEKQPEKRPLDANMVANTLNTIQEKVEAQQSAGVEAVRRRVIDRGAAPKRTDEEDREAARILMTGKGRSRRKAAKKHFYQLVWVQAIALVLALGVVGTLLYLVFRPPSAAKLYEQARKAGQSSDPDVRDRAIESSGAIRKYLDRYGNNNDEKTREVRGWDEQIRVEQKERLLDRYLAKQRVRSALKFEAQDQVEEAAFAATSAEEEGNGTKAAENWQRVKREGTSAWGAIAERHLNELSQLEAMDQQFKQMHDRIRITGKDTPLPDPLQQRAYLAWRADNSELQDHGLARQLLARLKVETRDNRSAHLLYLYATCNGKRLGDVKQDKTEVEKRALGKLQGDELKEPDKLLLCRDILALYAQDEDMAKLVQEAEKLRVKLQGS